MNIYLVPPSIDFIDGDENDSLYEKRTTLAITDISDSTGRSKRSDINNCPTNCRYQGNWTSLDTNDGTGDHENFP